MGTFARTDLPMVPVCWTTSSRPASAEDGSVLTILPSSASLGWVSRMPVSVVITTNSTPVPWRTLVAMFCSGPAASCSGVGMVRSACSTSVRTIGAAASTRATSRERLPYCSTRRRWLTPASRAKAMPRVSAMTASCSRKTCVASRTSNRRFPGIRAA